MGSIEPVDSEPLRLQTAVFFWGFKGAGKGIQFPPPPPFYETVGIAMYWPFLLFLDHCKTVHCDPFFAK